jgi:hypothetical protein
MQWFKIRKKKTGLIAAGAHVYMNFFMGSSGTYLNDGLGSNATFFLDLLAEPFACWVYPFPFWAKSPKPIVCTPSVSN